MIAKIEKVDSGYIARFERHLKHSVEKVWSMLTVNKELEKWFSELSVDDLREGGFIKFDMGDGTFEEMKILEFKTNSVLEYTWAEDIVRFELHQELEGCLLVLKEKIKTITNHTPKDLAGWHVCLDVIKALLDGTEIGSRDDAWKKWCEKYDQAIGKVSEKQV